LRDRLLPKRVLGLIPALDACGIDASADMLAQARVGLSEFPPVHLVQIQIGAGEAAPLPYAPGTFELITCTNALHYIPDPVRSLGEFRRLLAPGGHVVLEDFARPKAPFPLGELLSGWCEPSSEAHCTFIPWQRRNLCATRLGCASMRKGPSR
jgi:ubiquinone/menaquinone biosynthesis C-methylase UbiE